MSFQKLLKIIELSIKPIIIFYILMYKTEVTTAQKTKNIIAAKSKEQVGNIINANDVHTNNARRIQLRTYNYIEKSKINGSKSKKRVGKITSVE